MTEDREPVVPIRDDVRVWQPRSVALLEFVTSSLATFEADQEEPAAIAFLIYGKDGGTKVGWMNDVEIGESSLLALAAAHMLRSATDD
jgi:hypothetical protein